MDKLTRMAVTDALNFLSEPEVRGVLQSKDLASALSEFRLFDMPADVLRITLTAHRDEPIIFSNGALLDRVKTTLSDGEAERFFVDGANLHLLQYLPQQTDAYFVTLQPETVDHFLTNCFPGKRITPSQQRLLVLLLAGLSLTETAEHDKRSIETQKSHARDLRAHFDLATTNDVVRLVSAQLACAVTTMLTNAVTERHRVFFDYVRRFLPSCARAVILADANGQFCRVIDIGPQDGQPVIALHPLILPNVDAADIDELHRLNLRLIWPLRPGQLAPCDPVLSEQEMITRSQAALDLVRQTYGRGPLTILTFAAASKLALTYAQHAPGAVARIIFAAACELHGRPQDGPRRLARGLIALGGINAALQQTVISFFAHRVLLSQKFPIFLRAQFAASKADLAMIERELGAPWHGARMQAALLGSLRSMRHDFEFQRDLGWVHAARCRVPLHFVHGADDQIHPLPLVRGLADTLGATLHVLPEAGQLLYGPHLLPVLQQVSNSMTDGKVQA